MRRKLRLPIAKGRITSDSRNEAGGFETGANGTKRQLARACGRRVPRRARLPDARDRQLIHRSCWSLLVFPKLGCIFGDNPV